MAVSVDPDHVLPAVGYLRRSTTKQEASLGDQKREVIRYATEHGYRVVRWYVDDGISGDDTEIATAVDNYLAADPAIRDMLSGKLEEMRQERTRLDSIVSSSAAENPGESIDQQADAALARLDHLQTVSFRQACRIFGGVGLGTLWVANGDQRAVLVLASVEP